MRQKIENLISVMECIKREWEDDGVALTQEELNHILKDMYEIQDGIEEISLKIHSLVSSL